MSNEERELLLNLAMRERAGMRMGRERDRLSELLLPFDLEVMAFRLYPLVETPELAL